MDCWNTMASKNCRGFGVSRTKYCFLIGRICVFLGFLLLLRTQCVVEGTCVHDGFHYANNTIWESEPCTLCSCLGEIVSCQHKQCQNPECDFQRGERLKIAPNRCCPECGTSSGSCLYQGEIVGHNTQWRPEPCRECYCRAGMVHCSNTSCPVTHCSSGEVLQRIPGECCPQCIQPGRSCIYRGITYHHLQEWSPVKCAKCICKNGVVHCFVVDCPPLTCQQNQVAIVPEGKCCPECVGSSCQVETQVYPDGTSWRLDRCTFCQCQSGSVSCTQERCTSDLPCPMGERRVTRNGHCCPECVSLEAPCDMDGERWYSGDLWNISACEFCMCDRGRVECQEAECDRIQCGQGETLIHREGKCCPECVGPSGLCYFEADTYQDGQSWDVDECSICSCDRGEVNCYITECPPCPVGTVPVVDEGRCCPECITVQCPPECLSCDEVGCTSCRHGHLLQNGRCMDGCSVGYYQSSDLRCQPCHESCASCSAGTEYHCLTCQPGLLLKWGQCLQQCGSGFYAYNTECRECHANCHFCSGPREEDCISCANSTNVIQNNHCVEECSVRFYLQDFHCLPCDPSCQTCYPDNPYCTSCPGQELLQEGRCVPSCTHGFFQASQWHCESCHPTCLDCQGPGITECLSCQPGYVLQGDRCLSNCTMGYFNSRAECLPCHSSCRTCMGPLPTDCTSCQSQSQIVQGRPPFYGIVHGSCSGECQEGFYASAFGTCLACNPTCLTCSSSEINGCTSCRRPLLLQNGYCVRQCSETQYHSSGLCLDCHPSCHSCKGPSEDQCLSCYGSDALVSSRCIPGCPDAQYISPIGLCEDCSNGCSTCFALPPGRGSTGSTCTQCQGNERFPLGDRCVDECSVGFYQDTNGLCRACHISCRTCSGGSVYECTSCSSGRVLNNLGQCSETCFGGYYSDGGICKSCSPDCLECVSPAECLVCRNPSDVLQFGECSSLCAQQYFLDPLTRLCRECDWSCNACNGPSSSDCVECMDGLVLRDGTCLSSCGLGYFHIGEECKECGSNCASCLSPFGCTSCLYPFFLLGEYCVQDCGPGYYAEPDSRVCINCPPNCIECPTPDTCLRCTPGTYLSENTCLTHCGQNSFPNTETGLCDLNIYPPTLVVNGSITAEIGGTQVLNPSFFTAYDTDTSNYDLIFVVVSPPSNGQLIKIHRGVDIILRAQETFSYEDLLMGSIRYVHNAKKDLSGFVSFKVSDRQLESLPEDVGIVIVSPFPPVVTRNEPLVVEEGDFAQITPALNLQIHDEDNPSRVTVSVIESPKHGRLMRMPERERVRVFDLDALVTGSIHYAHDGTETQFDVALFQVSDGYNIVNVLFNIHILPKDNKGPVLVNNIQAQVYEGDIIPITSQHLKARDVDSDDSQLIYTLTPPANNPQRGAVMMVVPVAESGVPDGWEDMGNGLMRRQMYRFRQQDLDEGRIFYQNNGVEADSDYFMFEVSDTGSPPNILADQMFNIAVMPDNDEPPRLLPGIPEPLGILVREGEVTPITANVLTYTDPDSVDSTITYNITVPLESNEGSIEHADYPYIAVWQFTQADINAGKIVYRPPRIDIGSDSTSFLFQFMVTDVYPDGNTIGPFPFNITILPINNLSPTFRNPNPVLQVERGGHVPIRTTVADVVDLDTPVSRLLYTVVKAPQHGYLMRGGFDNLEIGDRFTRQELVENTLHYVHDGSSVMEDNFVIEVSDGQQESLLAATIFVLFVDEASPLVSSSTSLSMFVEERGNKTITSDIVSFHDDSSSPTDIEIRLISSPNFGKVQRRLRDGRYETIRQGSSFTQFDVDNYDIRYMAVGEIGSQPVNEILLLNITDANGNTLPNQVFSIAITPVNNERPVVTVADNFEVDEGARQSLNTLHIRATDADTFLSDLSIIISVPPSFGFVENIGPVEGSERSGAGEPIAMFSVQDLIGGNIYYVQRDHTNLEPVEDGFLFHVTDGINNSPPQIFNITIRLVNDEEPVIYAEQFLIEEGQGSVITNVTLYASDLDTPNDELIFEVVAPPTHGTLRRLQLQGDPLIRGRILGTGDSFTYEDVLNELLVYIHDGTDIPSDFFTLELDDGRFRAQETLRIMIGLVSDETPRVTINRGLHVQAGSTTLVSADELVATDVDSEDEDLLITLETDVTIGSLRFIKGNTPVIISTTGRKSSFSQGDINNGYIEYTHDMSEGAGTTVFKFSVTDPEGNRLIDQSFIITIVEDRIPPRVLANNPLVVDEGGSTVISTNCLSATDVDSIPGNLRYTVTNGPSQGHLELTSNPGIPVSEFTQADLAARSLIYVHTSQEENSMDSFIFTVSDGTNDVTQTFYINVSPVDDSLPIVTNFGVRVQEGVRKTITEFELKAQDADTPEDSVMFTIFQQPVHGTIDYLSDDGRYSPTITFTMSDIYENRISYNHDGTNTLQDSFEFTVSDGQNAMFMFEQDGSLVTTNSPQVFAITIMPVDDGTPRIVTNLGLGYLDYLDHRALGVITHRSLQTMDTDTEDRNLLYTVTSPPRHGYLENSLEVGIPITTFTQEDINNGVVRYVLEEEVDMVTSDRFVFDVSDTAPNIVSGTVFRIRWALIHFEKAVYNVSEQQGSIAVTVKRTGNLNQYSIVLCRTEPGSATSASSIGARPGLNDYVEHAGQVQFEEREDTKVCTIIINDDTIYEEDEEFIVALDTPAYALLGDPFTAVVAINDIEDKPTIAFEESVMHVNESSGFIFAPLVRTGDLSKTVTAICFTIPGSATGSSLSSLESGSDYKARGMDFEYQVVFPAGVRRASCDVKLIDDALFEEEEDFQVALAMPSLQARLGPQSRATVVIDGPNDESLIYLPHHEYIFNENAGTVEIEVIRQGSDLTHTSMVWCAPKPLHPPSANPGEDFVPSASQLTFRPQQTVEVCRITIVDDTASPRMEGNETFVVYLSSAMGSALSAPHEALIVINDTADVPTMQFSTERVTVEEKVGVVHIPIARTGDLSYSSSVVCYTRQKTAQVMMDYDERRNTDDFRIVFMPGERVKNCTVRLMEDSTFEPDEQFLVRLADAEGNDYCKAMIGNNKSAIVTITDREDAPMLQFERMAYSVREPSRPDQVQYVTVTIVRTGDRNRTSQVRLSTRDGSAKSGVDYEPYSNVLIFEPGMQSLEEEVEILYNEDREWHETFSVVLGPDDPVNAMLGPVSIATVTIIDEQAAGSIVLPTTPFVVSLMDFDDVANALESDPSPGYPLVCITPCDPQFPDYSMTGTICDQAGINATNIRYSWEVAMPTDAEGSRAPFERIVDDTPYTSANHKVLESIYFSRRFHVRCVAQPYDKYGRPGVPLRSNIVTIGTNNGICHTPVTTGVSRGMQAQSFIANLEYLDPTHEEHPNTIHVSVEIPHQDGMLPLISTLQIHNIRLLLTQAVYRQQHICSNLINNENFGGLEDYTFLDEIDYNNIFLGPGHDYPYQFDNTLREEKALRLYKHLNLKSCTWTFDTYYHMTELIDLCGGSVTTDFQVRDGDQSFLTVTVPLYVSYVYVTAPTGWASLDHRTEMEFSFFYQTILWRAGLETDSVLSGRLQVLRIRIGDNGNMIIDFKTTTKFRGMFVLSHHTLPEYESRVVPPPELGVGFDLELLWTEGTYDSPQQLWRATSDYNLKDYSGDYVIELLPCSVTTTQAYNVAQDGPPVCTAHIPQKFVVPIAFQQTNRPVPVVYSLNTEFHLMNNEKVFLMNPNEASISLQDMDYQGAFSQGQTIYGRVLWNPDQDLDQAYKLYIEKLYICTGSDGHSPFYDPSGTLYNQGPQFGCMQDTKNLASRFLILDRGSPDSVQRAFNDVPFDAQFASNSQQYSSVSEMPGVDGFTMQVDPLYKVNSGHQWYMQVIYTIGPADSTTRFRRSIMSPVQKRDSPVINGVSDDARHNGTNMHRLLLDASAFEGGVAKPNGNSSMTAVISGVVGTVLAVVVIVIVIFTKRKRTKRKQPVTETKAIPLNSTRVSAKPIKCSVEEIEMDLNKSVTVRSVNILKPNNQGQSEVKVKKVNLEVKLKTTNTEGGTEV